MKITTQIFPPYVPIFPSVRIILPIQNKCLLVSHLTVILLIQSETMTHYPNSESTCFDGRLKNKKRNITETKQTKRDTTETKRNPKNHQ